MISPLEIVRQDEVVATSPPPPAGCVFYYKDVECYIDIGSWLSLAMTIKLTRIKFDFKGRLIHFAKD